jgi:outer membrane protein OmpA-like peptidoglycan-associated protein
VYLGYQYVWFNPSGFAPSYSNHGGDAQFAYHFNRWIGAVVDVGAVNNGNINHTFTDSTMANFMLGPRFTFRQGARFTPFVQVLAGGAYTAFSTRVFLQPVLPFDFPDQPVFVGDPVAGRVGGTQIAFAAAGGVGLDIRLGRNISFRPFEVDYFLTRFSNDLTGFNRTQNNIRATGGFAFMFGGEKPAPVAAAPPPATHTCPDGTVVPANAPCPKQNVVLSLSASPSEVCPGETVHVIATVSGASPGQLTYTWTLNGQATGQGQAYDLDTTGRPAGTYQIMLGATGNGFNPASAQTTITVKEYRPPTGTAQANPAVVQFGEKSTLSAQFSGQCGGPISEPVCRADEGSVQGNTFDSSGVSFDPSNHAEQRKTVTLTCDARDNQTTGTATTTVEVVKGAAAMPVRLPDVLFPANSSRVNNCGKRILLEQLRGYVERDSGGTVYLVGHKSSDERAASLAQNRAMNAAAVITAGTGVCLSIPQSQVQISAPGVDQNGVSFESGFCQTSVGTASSASQMRRVVVWFVPAGGQAPESVTGSQAATALPVSSLGCPK